MKKSMDKVILAIMGVFILSLSFAGASVTSIDASETPADPDTLDNLQCSFTVVANDTASYTGTATWFKDGVSAGESDVSASNGDTKTVTLLSSNTAKDEDWYCEIVLDSVTEQSNTVTISNTAPQIITGAETSAQVGVEYQYNVDATDADQDDLVYSLAQSPAGMTIDADSGLIKWTPTEAQEGTESVSVSVTDDSAGEDTQDFSITITSNKLIVQDIAAKCTPSCDDDDLNEDNAMDGDAGTITDIEPGAELTLRVRVENIWPDNTRDHDINDVELECVLEDIEDEDEQSEDVDFGDLDPDERSSREELNFDIPLEAKDDETYNMECTLIGDDDDNTEYEIDFDVGVEVKKNRHSIVFQRSTLNPSTVSCNRHIVLDYKVQNIGSSNEDDIRVEARIDSLGLLEQQFLPELSDGDYDDSDTEYTGSFNFAIDDDALAGTYQIRLSANYDNDREEETEILDLVVQDCVTQAPVEPVEEPTQTEPPVVVIEQPPEPVKPPTQIIAEPAKKQESTVNFTESPWFIVLLAVAILILLVLVGLLIGVLVKK